MQSVKMVFLLFLFFLMPINRLARRRRKKKQIFFLSRKKMLGRKNNFGNVIFREWWDKKRWWRLCGCRLLFSSLETHSTDGNFPSPVGKILIKFCLKYFKREKGDNNRSIIGHSTPRRLLSTPCNSIFRLACTFCVDVSIHQPFDGVCCTHTHTHTL